MKMLKNSGVVIRQKNGKTRILHPDTMHKADEVNIKQKKTFKEIIAGILIKRALTQKKDR